MSNALKELEKLQSELTLIQDNIERLKLRQAISDGGYSWSEVGELKHRLVAVKSIMTKVCNYSTQDYVYN